MTFSTLFWNIWFHNQIKGEKESQKLLSELKRLVDLYRPDYIGLNEVLRASNSANPFIFDYLKNECGYEFGYFAASSQLNDDWLIGSGFCSKNKPLAISSVPICRDVPAERRGYGGSTVKAITVQIGLPGRNINVVVAHALVLRPDTLIEHYRGTKVLENLVHSEEFSKNTILGGDLNEPGFMPKAFKNTTKDTVHTRTGSTLDTTWRHGARQKSLIRANLDQLYWSKHSDFILDTFEVIDTNVSDHRPIFARFQLS